MIKSWPIYHDILTKQISKKSVNTIDKKENLTRSIQNYLESTQIHFWTHRLNIIIKAIWLLKWPNRLNDIWWPNAFKIIWTVGRPMVKVSRKKRFSNLSYFYLCILIINKWKKNVQNPIEKFFFIKKNYPTKILV